MNRQALEKKLKNVVITHFNTNVKTGHRVPEVTLEGLIDNLADLYESVIKKEVNNALQKQRHKQRKGAKG